MRNDKQNAAHGPLAQWRAHRAPRMTATAAEIATDPTFAGWPVWRVVLALQAGVKYFAKGHPPAPVGWSARIEDTRGHDIQAEVPALGYWPFVYLLPADDAARAEVLEACATLVDGLGPEVLGPVPWHRLQLLEHEHLEARGRGLVA